MEDIKNAGAKEYLALTGIFLLVLLGLFFLVKSLRSQNNIGPSQESSEITSSTDDHHAPPAPADDAIFKSLLDKPAPDFTLEAYDGRKIALADLKGKNVVIFFTEGAMCYPSCWDQMVAMTKEQRLNDDKTVALSIAVDPKNDWAQAVKQMPELSSSTVLLDVDKKVTSTYGVLTLTSSMHRGEFPGHTYIIVDKEGIVRYLLDDVDMQIRNKELLEALDKIS
ncbi:MAG: redoxin domain-containing protein [bacterium]|nr:redoxin domain-containing protein [bacterium]